MFQPAEQRFSARVDFLYGGCWEWKGTLATTGYGVMRADGRQLLMHRWSYEYYKGPIPDGYFVDHTCRNRACVNPDHLEAVTPGENTKRGVSVVAKNARKTHCSRGHEFNNSNTHWFRNPHGNMARSCLTCQQMHSRISYLKKLARQEVA